MTRNFDFNKRYNFKLSHSNDLDKDAHIIDERLSEYLDNLNEEEGEKAKEYCITKKELANKIDLSSFRPQKVLNPKVWINGKMNSRVRLRLLDIADDFIDTLSIDIKKVKDIILTGSLANYNWSKFSDFDVHILIDYSSVDKRVEFVKDYFNAKKNEWNNAHEDLRIYGFPVEVYVQDTNEEHTASGIYSLNKNNWIVKPESNSIKAIKLDKFLIKSKALKFISKISGLNKQIENIDDDAKMRILSKNVKKLFDNIKGLRKEGLKKSGEMSVGNIIYKVLRRMGYIDILLDLKTKTYDKLKSIE
jgi:predicted nucleotidyltransferase